MFCLDIMRGGANGLKSMLMICAILVFIGPIMIIVGIAMLGEPNNRSARVASYNAAGNWFKDNQFAALGSMPMQVTTAGGTVFTAVGTSPAVPVADSSKDIESFQSRIFTIAGVPGSVLSSASLTAGSSTFTPAAFLIPPTSSSERTISCSQSDCGDVKGCSCGVSTMERKCFRIYGGTSYNSRVRDLCSSSSSSTCGTCITTRYLTSVCIPVAVSGGSATASTTTSGCTYPFTAVNPVYDSKDSTATVSISVLSDKDPLLELLRITEGSRNFGLTPAEQYQLGTAILVVGIIICVAAVAIVVVVWCKHEPQPPEQQQQANVIVVQGQQQQPESQAQAIPLQCGTPVGEQQHHQQYPPGQPVYGQQQPGYAPSYAPAQPIYGQPPPPPPQPGSYGQQGGYPPQQPNYAPEQPIGGYPPAAQPMGYPPQQPPMMVGYPPQQQPPYQPHGQPQFVNGPPPQQPLQPKTVV